MTSGCLYFMGRIQNVHGLHLLQRRPRFLSVHLVDVFLNAVKHRFCWIFIKAFWSSLTEPSVSLQHTAKGGETLLYMFVFAQGRDWCSSSTLKPSQRCLAPPSGPSSSSSCCWRWASTVRWAPPTSTHFCSDNSPACNHPVLRQHSLDLIQSKWK